MLEQEAQMFGFRDRTLPSTENRSPQQMQTRETISLTKILSDKKYPRRSFAHWCQSANNSSFRIICQNKLKV
jgi:hypothetical protein